ncbi:autotransporter outer membrane beta-barrel domain-containing protein [Bradyrhizobium canariense]|uniref:autotransporter outer membrane beta-barrel domain-containing protein n=1 Tax=Bradyrhizobium canariense TaxID=255045 RepID=UPI001F0AFC4F|nr:autotransporter domain-containing protein [Bradyrhizobium canariense]
MKVKLGSTTRLQNSSSIHNKMSGGAMSGFGRFSNGRAALLALASTGLVGIAVPALGQDATWLANPGTADYNTAANWAPATVPVGTALFGSSNTTALTLSADTTVGGWTFSPGASNYVLDNHNFLQTLTFSGAGISVQGGSATITNSGFRSSIAFNGSSSAGGATITNTANGITIGFNDSSTAGSATITNSFSSTISFANSSTAGSAAITNGGGFDFLDASTAGSATIINNNGLQFADTSTGGSATIINNGSLEFANFATGGNAAITNGASSVTDFSDSTGPNNDHKLSAGSINGAGLFSLGQNELTVGGNNLSTNVTGVIADGGAVGGTGASLVKVGTGTMTLSAINTYTGATTVNGGTLAVNGDITSASGVIVNAGGTLGGIGTVGNTNVNGGTLAPGNSIGTLTVSGSLTMTAASTYLVQISGASSDMTVVTGIANLAGKVTVDPLARISATTTYTIMIAGTVNGTFDTAGVLAGNSFARNARVSYVGNEVFLTVDPGLLSPNLPANANINQKNVAAGIDNALLAGANMPAGFNALFALTGSGLATALTQVSGETATGSQQSTFNAMNLFMGVMTDPFIAGRGDGATAGGNATGYADEQALAYAARKRSPNDALAAIYTKAPAAVPFQQRWSVWAAGFGGSQKTDGNSIAGSNNTSSSLYGTAVGADYRISRDTLVGFALAGGGTNFSVVNGGGGRSDLFQAGAFVRHTVGAAYLSGALAYGWQDITTDRTITIAGIDRLRAQFNANAWSGRVESGYRFVVPVIGGIGFTPYAAGQFTTFDLPAYAEGVVSGANTFALAYNAKSVTDTRSELGLRADKSFAMQSAMLTLRGRVAWAHDFNPERGIGATFQTLPGASFFVNGAAQASESALVTASAETRWMNGWSTAATFEGEFSSVTRSYAGKGVVRYAW